MGGIYCNRFKTENIDFNLPLQFRKSLRAFFIRRTCFFFASNRDPLRWARSWQATLRAVFSALKNCIFNRAFRLVASDMSLATSFFISMQSLLQRALTLLPHLRLSAA